MNTPISRRRLLQAAGATAAIAAIPFGAAEAFAADSTASTSTPGPVNGFGVNLRHATVTDFQVDTTADVATLVVQVPAQSISPDFLPGVRFHRGDD